MLIVCSSSECTHLIFPQLAPTSLSTTVEPSEYSLGDVVNVTCTWDTPVYYVAWYKDGVLISSEDLASGNTLMSPSGVSVANSYEDRQSILSIANISITDTGNYTCAVSCGAKDVAFNMIDDLKSTILVTDYGEIGDDDLYFFDSSQPLTLINFQSHVISRETSNSKWIHRSKHSSPGYQTRVDGFDRFREWHPRGIFPEYSIHA